MQNCTIKTILIASLAFATANVHAADSETAPRILEHARHPGLWQDA